MFLTVMIVFIAAYAVPATALLNKHVDEFYWGIFWDLLNVGIWDVFGEVNGDAKQGSVGRLLRCVCVCAMRPVPLPTPDMACANYTSTSTFSWDCTLRIYPVPIMLVSYLLFVNILLVNMLIAIFSFVNELFVKQFKCVQPCIRRCREQVEDDMEVSDVQSTRRVRRQTTVAATVYTVQSCCYGLGDGKVVGAHNSTVPTALLADFPSHVYDRFVAKIFGVRLNERDEQSLQMFEQNCRADYLEGANRAQRTHLRYMLKELTDDVGRLTKLLEEHRASTATSRGPQSLYDATTIADVDDPGADVDWDDAMRENDYDKMFSDGDQ
ncbi:unnamed protein product [Sphagnum balticum]